MRHLLPWIIVVTLLVQIAQCDSIRVFIADRSRYTNPLANLKLGVSAQEFLPVSSFRGIPYGPESFGRRVVSPESILRLSLLGGVGNSRTTSNSDDEANPLFQMLLKFLLGPHAGRCKDGTRACGPKSSY